MSEQTLSIATPFDAHLHAREGGLLWTVAPLTARRFWGAIFEPNLAVPITTGAQARTYRQKIYAACKDHGLQDFKAYVLAYFTDTIDPEELARSCEDDSFIGLKFYPKGTTTNSDNGVTDVTTLWKRGTRQYEAIRAVHAAGKVVQLHGELNYDLDGEELDAYDKEAYFYTEIMPRLMDAHEGKFSAEHITTAEAADFVLLHGSLNRLGCSITCHHLLKDRRDMFRGGLRPHLFCLPVPKRARHRRELQKLVSAGLPFVYAGTDSAPHDRRKKECDCCSGGVFTAHAAVELYAQAFEDIGALDERFEGFMSKNGPDFYGLPRPDTRLTLVQKPWTVDAMLHYSSDSTDVVRPYGYEDKPEAREIIRWQIA